VTVLNYYDHLTRSMLKVIYPASAAPSLKIWSVSDKASAGTVVTPAWLCQSDRQIVTAHKINTMKETSVITTEILSLIKEWESKLTSLPNKTITEFRNSQNRSIKQVLGHLIDSTSNNTHRVVHMQYQQSPFSFPNYATFGNNDRWIAIHNYQNEDWQAMIQLWKYSLLHFCHIIKNVNDDKLENEWISGPDKNITFRTMILDFPRHLKLHLNEIKELINSKP